MQIIKTFTSYEGHRIICPSTDEIIWEPDFEEYNTEAAALKGMWFSDELEEPEINDADLKTAWEAFLKNWEDDPDSNALDVALESFFQQYPNPGWVVYLCDYYRMASVYYVVPADTIIEEDPVHGSEYRDKHNYIKNAQLSVIHFPKGTTSIKDCACYSYHNLEKVHIPDSVTSIGKSAFMFCTNLKQLKLPNTITHIGEAAFRECTALEHIDLPNALTTIPNEMFFNCKRLKAIVMPDPVTYIGNRAFEGCESLKSIYIPANVEAIGDDVFKGCLALEELVVPKNIKKDTVSAFDNAIVQKIVYY